MDPTDAKNLSSKSVRKINTRENTSRAKRAKKVEANRKEAMESIDIQMEVVDEDQATRDTPGPSKAVGNPKPINVPAPTQTAAEAADTKEPREEAHYRKECGPG